MGEVYKNNIFTFFILIIFLTRFLNDFGLFGASKIVQKRVTRTGNSHLKSVLSAKMLSRPFFGAQTDPEDRFKTIFWSPNYILRHLQGPILTSQMVSQTSPKRVPDIIQISFPWGKNKRKTNTD